MWAQVWDGHLESQKNLDRLKRSIHVDRIGVQSTFVYIYVGLRVLMIWANRFFLLTCLFCWNSRRCDDNQQITVSHFGEHERLHIESSTQKYYIISLRAIIKAIFTSLYTCLTCQIKILWHMAQRYPTYTIDVVVCYKLCVWTWNYFESWVDFLPWQKVDFNLGKRLKRVLLGS